MRRLLLLLEHGVDVGLADADLSHSCANAKDRYATTGDQLAGGLRRDPQEFGDLGDLQVLGGWLGGGGGHLDTCFFE